MTIKTAIAQEPAGFLFRQLWQYAGELRGKIVQYVLLFILANCVMLASPLIFGTIIGEIQVRGVTSANILFLLLMLSLLFFKDFLFWLLHGPARVIERLVAFSASNNYRRHLLQCVLDLRLDWHGTHDSGDTIDKVNKAGDSLSEFSQSVFEIIQVIVKLLGTSAVLFWFSPWIGSFVFVFVIFSFVIVFQFDKRLIPQYRGLNEFSNKASASVFDALSNITTIKILHIEKPVLEGVISRFKVPYSLYRSNAILNEWKWFTGIMLFQGIAFFPIALHFYHGVLAGQAIDVGTVSTLYLYLSDLIFCFFSFGSRYEQLTIFKNRIVNAEPIEQAHLALDNIERGAATGWQSLAIRHLSFGYEGSNDVANLNKISLKVNRGERVAVIGESGSGKSTFLKVLHGMYPAAKGLVIFDDKNSFLTSFADIDLKTMLVPQEPEIFSSTIRENMTLGIEYSESQVLLAAHVAGFDTVIAQLPKGLESVINEKGVNLSGGQKQRLALTRALLFSADKELILLDESTSSVDPENELEIYKKIWKAFPQKTIIASIHKMNLLKLFDRIVMFDKGRIVDEGTFDDLLRNNMSFRAAWKEFVTTNEESKIDM